MFKIAAFCTLFLCHSIAQANIDHNCGELMAENHVSVQPEVFSLSDLVKEIEEKYRFKAHGQKLALAVLGASEEHNGLADFDALSLILDEAVAAAIANASANSLISVELVSYFGQIRIEISAPGWNPKLPSAIPDGSGIAATIKNNYSSSGSRLVLAVKEKDRIMPPSEAFSLERLVGKTVLALDATARKRGVDLGIYRVGYESDHKIKSLTDALDALVSRRVDLNAPGSVVGSRDAFANYKVAADVLKQALLSAIYGADAGSSVSVELFGPPQNSWAAVDIVAQGWAPSTNLVGPFVGTGVVVSLYRDYPTRMMVRVQARNEDENAVPKPRAAMK
jgi:hypothetical protein